MLLDQRLILAESDLLTQLDSATDVIDISALGLESSEMMAFMLFLTEANAGSALLIELELSAAVAMTSPTVIGTTGTLSPSTTAIPAGTLYRFPIPQIVDIDDGVAVGATKKYLSFDFEQTAPAADELFICWVGRSIDIPVGVGRLS